MPETINSVLVTEKNKVHNTAPWIWLFEIAIDGTEVVRVAGYHSNIAYGGQTYTAFPIQIGVQSRDARGVLNEIEIIISNLSREIAGYLESGKIIDQKVKVRCVHSANLAQKIHEGIYSVLSATLTLSVAIFLIGPYNLMKATFPAQRYNRTRCRWDYGGAGCGYTISLPNNIAGTNPLFVPATCDLGLETSNGCRVHGLNEVANGLPKKHPLRFGGFPGIPKGPARV